MSQREPALTEVGADAIKRPVRHLGSTYRLQLNGVGFGGAAAAVPFLADLGIETLYVSPITQARRGSSHGYDVVDPTAIDPALGGRPGYDRLLDELGQHGMRLLIDIVPNHMAASVENPMFADVLRHGRRSRYAAAFDIAWEAADNAIVLPILDGPLSAVLDAGRLRLERNKAAGYQKAPGHQKAPGYQLGYDDLVLPLDPAQDEDIAAELADSGDLKEPVGRRHLELLLSHQSYRLVDWRSAGQTVNYRRFFDINELIGVRQEDAEVFALTHRLIVELASDQRVAGFRVDHVDGLRDPAHYLSMLRKALDRASEGQPDRPAIVVEKILERDEPLPPWSAEGTTGYEFAALVTGLFVDAAGATKLAADLTTATGDARSFHQRAVETKRTTIDALFPARLGYVSRRMTQAVPHDVSERPNLADISIAIEALSAHLDVYRTYRRPGARLTHLDRTRIDLAAGAARADLNDRETVALEHVMSVLRGSSDLGSVAWEAIAGWQQLTPAITAKGVEDTALYTPGTMLAAADVGTDPDHPAVEPAEFHASLARRARRGRGGLSALSTHDSKRSHDVRCRLAVLSEMPVEWDSAVASLEAIHGDRTSDAADRRHLYESLVGAWPVNGDADTEFVRRVQEYVVKAAREAKRISSWLHPDERYEAALQRLVADLVDDAGSRSILESVVAAIEIPGATNSLASVVLRCAAPGVPDVYQSDDLWFQALVDPDNRRRFDLARHRSAADRSRVTKEGDLLASWRDGRVKQRVLREAMRARRRHPDLFAQGDFAEVAVTGPAAAHVIAFALVTSSEVSVAIAPRLCLTLAGSDAFAVGSDIWGDTTIEIPTVTDRGLIDVLSDTPCSTAGPRLKLAELLSSLPVALLIGSS